MIGVAIAVVTAIILASPLRAQAPRFSEHLIQDGYTYTYGVGAGDLDGDGDVDLTSADAFGHDSLYWFQNDGTGKFTKLFIQKDDPERLERHALGERRRRRGSGRGHRQEPARRPALVPE